MADRTVRFILSGDSSGSVRAMKETAAAAEATGTKIGDTIDKGTTKAGGALSKLGAQGAAFGIPFSNSLTKIGDKFSDTDSKGQKFLGTVNEVGKVALAAGAVGLIAFGGEAVKLGNQLEESQASLKAAVTASGQSMTNWQGPIAASQAKLEKLGFTNADVNSALAKSVISTQDVGKSLNIMTIAADLAAAKHVDLSTAINAVDKAAQGNTKALMQMGISLPIVATNALKLSQANDAVQVAQAKVNAIQAAGGQGTAQYQAAVDALHVSEAKLAQQHAASGQILDALSQRLKGQAAAAADTFAGKMKVLKAEASDVGAQIGTKLIPVIEGLVGFLAKNKGAVEAVAVAIGVTLGAAVAVFVGNTVVSFAKGVGSMVSALGGLVTKMAGTAAAVETEDGAIIAANEGVAASFTGMLGPIAAIAAAGAVAYIGTTKLLDKLKELATVKPQYTLAGGGLKAANAEKAVGINYQDSTAQLGAASIKYLEDKQAADATKAAAAAGKQAASQTAAAANAALLAAEKQAAGGTASSAAAKTSSSEATKAANAIIAEHKKAAAQLVADAKSGQSALSAQLNLTTSTSLTSLAAGLNKTHNAALAALEKTLDKTHNKNLVSLAANLVNVHKQALANWAAQSLAAAASARLAAAGGTANIIGLQETISEDTANMAGLTGDALTVAQAQLALDQQKLTDAQQAAQLQSAVDAAGTASAKANAQAALDNFNALATIQEAQLSAALSGAGNQQTLNSNAASAATAAGTTIPAFATGGVVQGTSQGTIVRVGEKGITEAIVPLTGQGSVSPLAAYQPGASTGDQGTVELNLVINGQKFATAVSQDLRTALLKKGRNQITIGLS